VSVSHDTIQFTKEIIMHQLGIKPGVVFGTPTDELIEEVEDYFVKRFYTVSTVWSRR
jgi:RecA/RadA recombinase